MSSKNARSNDWLQEADMLARSIEEDWNVRVSTNLIIAQVINGLKVQVWHATAAYAPRQAGKPGLVTVLLCVDRQYLSPQDRAKYMALHNLWVALEALDKP